MGDVREKLEQSTKQVLDAFPGNAVVGRGLEKLLLDRTEFDTVAKSELSELREKIFSRSSALLQGKSEVGLWGFKVYPIEAAHSFYGYARNAEVPK